MFTANDLSILVAVAIFVIRDILELNMQTRTVRVHWSLHTIKTKLKKNVHKDKERT